MNSYQTIEVKSTQKIEFIDMSLKKLGYSPRQTLNVK